MRAGSSRCRLLNYGNEQIMKIKTFPPKILYGGDYNPEQWPEETWAEDMRLFREAGIDTVTLNVFSWAALQPSEDEYDFSKLDRIIALCTENDLNIILATSTGAVPAWMARRHPDVLRTEADGMRRKFGGRHNFCPNSPTFRRYAPELAKRLAQRYGKNPKLIAWHIGNEYGGACHCENCERVFREWLKVRYGTIDALNEAWNTSFWGHTFYDWDEIVIPDLRSEVIDGERTMFSGISLDYDRFMNDSILDCFKAERDQIRAVTPDIPVTTNLMGFYKPLDYFQWGPEMDMVSWDNYPANEDSWTRIAMAHDLMRAAGGQDAFWLMEQTPSVTNWLPYNALKRPGVMRLWSLQAVAHGADTVMFFQMRRSAGACEKLHGAVIDHAGRSDTRVFREISALGEELEQLGPATIGARTPAQTAMIFDWDNWRAVSYSAGPSRELDALREFGRWYDALRELNVDVDIVPPGSDLSKYRLVVAPVWYMVKGNDDEALRSFVKNGGTAVTTFFSGLAQENDLITDAWPGKLRDIFGVWIEESDALPEGQVNAFGFDGRSYPARLICDIIRLEGARQIDNTGYHEDFYRGMPVITENDYGDGHAYYVGTASKKAFCKAFLAELCEKAGVEPVMKTPDGVEVTRRSNENGSFVFLLNHNHEHAEVRLPWSCRDAVNGRTYKKNSHLVLPAKDVRILRVSADDSKTDDHPDE